MSFSLFLLMIPVRRVEVFAIMGDPLALNPRASIKRTKKGLGARGLKRPRDVSGKASSVRLQGCEKAVSASRRKRSDSPTVAAADGTADRRARHAILSSPALRRRQPRESDFLIMPTKLDYQKRISGMSPLGGC